MRNDTYFLNFRSEFEGLKGTGVKEAVELDLKNISEEFNQFVLPFVCKHTELFP